MGRTVIESYPHQLGGHCGSGALRDLLPWAGLGWGSLPGDGLPGEGLVFGMEGVKTFAMTFPPPGPFAWPRTNWSLPSEAWRCPWESPALETAFSGDSKPASPGMSHRLRTTQPLRSPPKPAQRRAAAWSALGAAAMAEPMDIRAVGEATQLLPACERAMQRALEQAGKSV